MPITENDTTNSSSNVSNVKFNLRFTELRNNPLYVRYYSLIGSGFVMVILPMFILISTFITLMRYIPKGSTKNKTMRIMAIIIIMFVTCHLPKVSWTIQVVYSATTGRVIYETKFWRGCVILKMNVPHIVHFMTLWTIERGHVDNILVHLN